ncbi:MAG: putative fluoride ion transporter CrcB [Candidatus Nitrosotenuis sp.]|nr:putative fluoride ion transporter CrcB [Candidatus Nitrosotenuis sp.]
MKGLEIVFLAGGSTWNLSEIQNHRFSNDTEYSFWVLRNLYNLDNSQFSLAAINIIANGGLSIGALIGGRTPMNYLVST